MSSPKSPYKALGLDSFAFPKKQKVRDEAWSLFSRVREPEGLGHLWGADLYITRTSRRGRVQNQSTLCKKCEQPRFVVESLPCRGRK